jgi:hypothetical protein
MDRQTLADALLGKVTTVTPDQDEGHAGNNPVEGLAAQAKGAAPGRLRAFLS